jgi:hypothetical protein
MCYPVGARVGNFVGRLVTCKKVAQTFVDELKVLEEKNPKDITVKEESMLEGKVLGQKREDLKLDLGDEGAFNFILGAGHKRGAPVRARAHCGVANWELCS